MNCFPWQVKYSILTKDNSMQPVNHVSLNISNQGVVPKEPQIFCLLLPCGNLMPSKLEVSMRINFTSFNNVTVLNVVMKKDCSSGKDYNLFYVTSGLTFWDLNQFSPIRRLSKYWARCSFESDTGGRFFVYVVCRRRSGIWNPCSLFGSCLLFPLSQAQFMPSTAPTVNLLKETLNVIRI